MAPASLFFFRLRKIRLACVRPASRRLAPAFYRCGLIQLFGLSVSRVRTGLEMVVRPLICLLTLARVWNARKALKRLVWAVTISLHDACQSGRASLFSACINRGASAIASKFQVSSFKFAEIGAGTGTIGGPPHRFLTTIKTVLRPVIRC